jgi:hypothetical protein
VGERESLSLPCTKKRGGGRFYRTIIQIGESEKDESEMHQGKSQAVEVHGCSWIRHARICKERSTCVGLKERERRVD